MGTTRADFENPEFVLLGCDDKKASKAVKNFYHTIHDKPVFETSIRNAELIKVVYNTYISSKIAYINTIMEVCHKIGGADVDVISDALALATDRIISPKYLRGGMGDGGGCHPRDNIALSWLARELDLKFDLFDAIMKQRELQTEWLADLVQEEQDRKNYPVIICGKAFKRGTNLTIGSPSVLLANILKERNLSVDWYDPHVYPEQKMYEIPAVYFIGCNHEEFEDLNFPKGSVVLDPWNIVKEQDGVEIIRIGRNK
jgi:UDPglucose 6-dehydrogenase